MSQPKSPFQIPALDTQYTSGALTANPDVKYPPSETLNRRVSVYHGDITKLQFDAIVNAANSRMRGGSGVDGSIHRAAGPGLLRELIAIAPEGCKTGQAILSQGHKLPARFVLHTVGPIYNQHPHDAEELLRSCYESCLRLAEENGIRSIAFCGISTGIYGFPSHDAARVACDVVRKYLEADEETKRMNKVVFVTFDKKDADAYKTILPSYFPPHV